MWAFYTGLSVWSLYTLVLRVSSKWHPMAKTGPRFPDKENTSYGGDLPSSRAGRKRGLRGPRVCVCVCVRSAHFATWPPSSLCLSSARLGSEAKEWVLCRRYHHARTPARHRIGRLLSWPSYRLQRAESYTDSSRAGEEADRPWSHCEWPQLHPKLFCIVLAAPGWAADA